MHLRYFLLTLRLRCLIIGWGCVGCAYLFGGLFAKKPVTIPLLWLDQAIAFNPFAIWGYLSFFILIPLAYLLVDKNRLMAYLLNLAKTPNGSRFALLSGKYKSPHSITFSVRKCVFIRLSAISGE